MDGFRLTFFAAVAACSVAVVFSTKCCFTGSSGKQRCLMSDVGCNQCNLAGEVKGNIYIPIGCFGGIPFDNYVYSFRSLPTLWKKWPDFSWLAKLCAEKALDAGWDLFSLEYWGLCRGGNLTEVASLGWDTFSLEYGPQCWPGVLTQQNYGMGLPRLVDQSRCFKAGMKAGTFDCVGGTARDFHSFVYHIQRDSPAAAAGS